MSGRDPGRDRDAPRLRVDTHVHFHSCYEEVSFLDAAIANLDPAASASTEVFAAICLTETSAAHWFDDLMNRLSSAATESGGWRIEATEEPNSLLALGRDQRRLAIIAGRQIAAREGLEVLAIGLAEPIQDGTPIREVIARVGATGAVPIVPWGFGKWSGRRGKVVRELLDNPPFSFALGDNGGRPAALPEPRLLAEGRNMGFAVFSGTDPFPFSWERSKIGRYGMQWSRSLDASHPFRDLRDLMTTGAGKGRPFGRLETIPAFVRNQIAILAHKRRAA